MKKADLEAELEKRLRADKRQKKKIKTLKVALAAAELELIALGKKLDKALDQRDNQKAKKDRASARSLSSRWADQARKTRDRLRNAPLDAGNPIERVRAEDEEEQRVENLVAALVREQAENKALKSQISELKK